MLATRLIEARAQQEGRVSLYDWIVYNEDLKLEKGEEGQRHSKSYTILGSRELT